MKIKHNFPILNKFYYGLAIFLFSASTIAFVTDPFLMADFALVVLGIGLMISGSSSRGIE